MTRKQIDPDIRMPARLPVGPIFLSGERPRRKLSNYLDDIETKLACDIARLDASTRNIVIVLIARIRLGVQKGEDTTELFKHLRELTKYGMGKDPTISGLYVNLAKKWDSEMGEQL